jgi:hypothetical protein
VLRELGFDQRRAKRDADPLPNVLITDSAGSDAEPHDHPGVAARADQTLVPRPASHRLRVPDYHQRCVGAGAGSPASSPSPTRPSGITRPVLEDYLAWLLSEGYSNSTRALTLSRVFLDASSASRLRDDGRLRSSPAAC